MVRLKQCTTCNDVKTETMIQSGVNHGIIRNHARCFLSQLWRLLKHFRYLHGFFGTYFSSKSDSRWACHAVQCLRPPGIDPSGDNSGEQCTMASCQTYHWYPGIVSRSMLGAVFPSWEIFSATVRRPRRSTGWEKPHSCLCKENGDVHEPSF